MLLLRQGMELSASRVGRILAYLKRSRQLREPLRRTSARRRPWKRQYATRKPKSYVAIAPGDIVQIDTMDVRPEPGVVLKQFATVDVVSRWSVPTIASNATAVLASRALEELIARTPFPIKAIQVDGGSEFMAEFEEACQQKGILLFELPPRSPKLNGRVERANRTYREEFYDCSTATPTVAGSTLTTMSAHTRPSATSPLPSSSPPSASPSPRRNCHGRPEPVHELDTATRITEDRACIAQSSPRSAHCGTYPHPACTSYDYRSHPGRPPG